MTALSWVVVVTGEQCTQTTSSASGNELWRMVAWRGSQARPAPACICRWLHPVRKDAKRDSSCGCEERSKRICSWMVRSDARPPTALHKTKHCGHDLTARVISSQPGPVLANVRDWRLLLPASLCQAPVNGPSPPPTDTTNPHCMWRV